MLLYRYSKLYLLYHVFVYPKHVSWVPFLSFFKLKRYSWKKMLWQTSACICSVAKSIIFFEWKRLIYLFIYFHLGDKTAALRFYFEKKIAWPILVCFILKGRVTMRRYANQFIPQFSVLFKTLKSPPRPSLLISEGSMEGGCVPSNQHRELIHTRWFLANGTSLVSAGQTFFFQPG